MDQAGRGSTTAFGGCRSSTRRPWTGGIAAAAWVGAGLLTVLWSDQPGSEWDYTGQLGAAFAALGLALAFATLANFWLACLPRIQRIAPWMLALALLLAAWEAATAKLA